VKETYLLDEPAKLESEGVRKSFLLPTNEVVQVWVGSADNLQGAALGCDRLADDQECT